MRAKDLYRTLSVAHGYRPPPLSYQAKYSTHQTKHVLPLQNSMIPVPHKDSYEPALH